MNKGKNGLRAPLQFLKDSAMVISCITFRFSSKRCLLSSFESLKNEMGPNYVYLKKIDKFFKLLKFRQLVFIWASTRVIGVSAAKVLSVKVTM